MSAPITDRLMVIVLSYPDGEGPLELAIDSDEVCALMLEDPFRGIPFCPSDPHVHYGEVGTLMGVPLKGNPQR